MRPGCHQDTLKKQRVSPAPPARPGKSLRGPEISPGRTPHGVRPSGGCPEGPSPKERVLEILRVSLRDTVMSLSQPLHNHDRTASINQAFAFVYARLLNST
jgi:hypothetical protein